MSRISDRTQILMYERWRASIPRAYRFQPDWHERQWMSATGDIRQPFPAEGALNTFWQELASPIGWSAE